MARRRRRLRVRALGLGAILLAIWILLGGPGIPSDETPSGPEAAGPVPSAANVAVEEPDPAPLPVPDPDPDPDPNPIPDHVPVPVPDQVPDHVPDPTRGAAHPAVRAALADRLEGLLHVVHTSIDAGRFGAAWSAMESAAALHLTGTLLARRTAMRVALDRRLDAQIKDLTANAARGDVLATRAALRRLRDPSHAAVEQRLTTALAARGWPAWGTSTPADGDVPTIDPLVRGRSVRLHFRGRWATGRVVGFSKRGAAVEEVTVEVPTGTGHAYPFVMRNALEPVGATLDEAVAQAGVAIHAGDASLAAIWLGYCHELGGGADDRVRTLSGRL